MLSSAQAFGFKQEIPRYIRDCKILLSRTLCRQNILFCNIKSPAAGYKYALVARLSYQYHILHSLWTQSGWSLTNHVCTVQNYDQLLGHTNFLVSSSNLQAEQKSHCGMITILAQATAGKYDAKIKYPKNMFLFTAFLFNFSCLHTKITPASEIKSRFCSLFFCDV